MSRLVVRALAGASGVLLCVASASASLFGGAGDYNAFLFGNLNAIGGDTEGRLAVGGNATMQYYSVGYHSPDSKGTLDHLVVGGDLNAIGNWQVFGGNTKYGGKLVGSPSTVAPNTISQGSPIAFGTVQTQMQDLAADLAAMPDTGTSWREYSTLNIKGEDPVLNVVTINPSDWASVSDRQITAPAGSTLIINIPGATNSMSGGLALNGISRGNVLYNFYESTTINASSIALYGSMLAPYATLNLTSGSIDGNAILLNAVQRNGGEFHNYPFTGTPEPATVGLLLVGMALCRRRRRSDAGGR